MSDYRIEASAKPSRWLSTWSFTLPVSTAGGALRSSCQSVDSMERLTGSSSSLNPCRRSTPRKERSYDRTLATVVTRNGVVPRRCMRRRYARANVTNHSTIVPDGNVDGSALDRPRRRTNEFGRGDLDIRARNRYKPPDIYRNDPIADPVAADDRDGYERHHAVESATGPHQHHRQLSVSPRLHRNAAQRWHGRSLEYRRRFLRRRLCGPGAV